MDGIISIYKEQGFTSFDVVAKLRGILKQKKIGHTGTLDPMAEGVLIVCLGKATKLVDMLTNDDKCYKTTMRLGITTDTEDVTGAILSERPISDEITETRIKNVLAEYVTSYDQIPPMYSAIKKDGKKLYEYARAGIEVERTPRNVTIFSITDISVNLPDVTFTVHCSKGTYIRSLCRDIGETLGCGATMAALVREEVHGVMLADSYKLSEVEVFMQDGTILQHIKPMDELLAFMDALSIKDEHIKYLANGNKLQKTHFKNLDKNPEHGDIFRIYAKDKLFALYQYDAEERLFRNYKMFLSEQDLRDNN